MAKIYNSNFPKERIILIDKNKFYCRICGLEQLEAPWGDDDKTANFEFVAVVVANLVAMITI